MSFNFSWADAFSPSFCESAKNILEGALNKGNTPALIDGRIEVRELDMGKIPPTLALLEIGDLQADRFKGIFRLGYDGDARLVLGARVQANPLNPSPSPLPTSTAPLAAHRPLLVPMALTLSNLRLRAIVVLIVSKHNGITIVFKNDPLESLDVSSTFDSISVLKGFIQKEIEGQLREMFREDLPGIIHTLSQRWFSSEASVEVERPSAPTRPTPPSPLAVPSTTPRGSRGSASSVATPTQDAPPSPPTSSFPDLEDYDPTYGLRPEGLPTHTVISGAELGKIWERNRGFGEIFEDDFPEPGDGDEMFSQRGSADRTLGDDASIPATPRLAHHVHSSSLYHRGSSPAPAPLSRARPPSRAQSYDFGRLAGRPPPAPARYQTPPLSHSMSTTPSRSSASLATPGSSAMGYGPPPMSAASHMSVSPQHNRTLSVSQGLPETISHLSQLSLSNHTLSQHTREHAHVAMRSHPPTAFRANGAYGTSSGLTTPGSAAPKKAMRKRMHRLNTATAEPASAPASTATSGRSTAACPSASSSVHSSPPHSRRSSAFPPPPPPVFAATPSTPLRPKLEPRASYGFPPVFEETSSAFAPTSRSRFR